VKPVEGGRGGRKGERQGIGWGFDILTKNFLPLGNNVRSNITLIPHPGNDLCKMFAKIQISLPPRDSKIIQMLYP